VIASTNCSNCGFGKGSLRSYPLDVWTRTFGRLPAASRPLLLVFNIDPRKSLAILATEPFSTLAPRNPASHKNRKLNLVLITRSAF
jgi:hypothetical protein